MNFTIHGMRHLLSYLDSIKKPWKVFIEFIWGVNVTRVGKLEALNRHISEKLLLPAERQHILLSPLTHISIILTACVNNTMRFSWRCYLLFLLVWYRRDVFETYSLHASEYFHVFYSTSIWIIEQLPKSIYSIPKDYVKTIILMPTFS